MHVNVAAPAPMEVEAWNAAGAWAADDDDDGRRPRRTGTVWTASAHIITAVIGSGVLSLAWAVAQLGWVAGPAAMLVFAVVTYYAAALLAECYRTGDPAESTGKRNRTYTDAVRSTLGGGKAVTFCGVIQYANLVGIAVGYTIASSISMRAIRRAGCFHTHRHRHGHGHAADDACTSSSHPYTILFGAVQVLLSQIPDFDRIWWLSGVAAVMSFTYSGIGLSLGIARTVANGRFAGSIAGVSVGGVSFTQKMWRSLQAFGNIAFAYNFSIILIEIQDTIKDPPPSEAASEAKVMKKATALSVATTTVLYILCGCMGYAAFGDDTPDNLLTGFGFYEPFWLLDVANVAIVAHLVGAYQVLCQPVFAFVERRASAAWPGIALAVVAGVSPFRVAWRSAFVCLTTVAAMLLPFFGDVVGLLGAVSFWPLAVFLPVEMYVKRRAVPRWSPRWVRLQMLSAACLVVSVAAAAGSIADVVDAFKSFRPFSG